MFDFVFCDVLRNFVRVLGWLACLVEWNVFDEVQLSFLPVGHTHEDIDQFFSRLAVWLRHHNSTCRYDLTEAIKSCYRQPGCHFPIVIHRETAANISDWLAPHLGNRTKFKGVRDDYYCYSLIRRHDHKAVVRCREWPGMPEEWRGFDFTDPHTLVLEPIDGNLLVPDDLTDDDGPTRLKVPLAQAADRVIRKQRIAEKAGNNETPEQARAKHWAKMKATHSSMVAEGKLNRMARQDLAALITIMTADPQAFDWDTNIYRVAHDGSIHGRVCQKRAVQLIPEDALHVGDYLLIWCAADDADPRSTPWHEKWRVVQVAQHGVGSLTCASLKRVGADKKTATWTAMYSRDAPVVEVVNVDQVLMPLKLTKNLRIQKQGRHTNNRFQFLYNRFQCSKRSFYV